MKTIKNMHCLLVLFVTLSTTFSYGAAMAETEYLGEVCFSIDSRVEGTPDKTLYLGMFSFGGRHYSAHGKMTVEGRAGVIPVHGAVVNSGEGIVITLSGSDHGRGSDEIKFHAIIDQNPGSYSTIEHLDLPRATSEIYDYGQITLTTCR